MTETVCDDTQKASCYIACHFGSWLAPGVPGDGEVCGNLIKLEKKDGSLAVARMSALEAPHVICCPCYS